MGLLRNYVRVRPATYEEDGLDSVTSLTNPAGALANSYTFDSSGQVKTRSILTAVSADLSQQRVLLTKWPRAGWDLVICCWMVSSLKTPSRWYTSELESPNWVRPILTFDQQTVWQRTV